MSEHTVLIVDDSKVDLEIISIVCRALGCEVEVACDGLLAIETYHPERHDLVLCDYRMEPKSGIHVVSEIRKKDPEAKCIMISGYPDGELRAFAEEAHVLDIIVKPINANKLKETLRLALESDEGATEEVTGIALSNRMDDCEALSRNTPEIIALRDQLTEQISSDRPFMLVGPRGTAKRELAEFVHSNGSRGGSACVVLDCSQSTPDEIDRYLVNESGETGLRVREAEKGTLILHRVDSLPLKYQQALAMVYDELITRTRLILLLDTPLEDGLEQGTIGDEFYFKVASIAIEVPH